MAECPFLQAGMPVYQEGALKCKASLVFLPGKFTIGGGDRIRTGVQTYSSKAFYMLICSLIVGKRQGNNKPISSLAG